MLEFLLLAGQQAGKGGGEGGGFSLISLIPLVLIFVVFYFFLIRPQKKKQEQHQEMLDNLRKGDRVITSGGIKGKIVRVSDDELEVSIAEGTKVEVSRNYISEKVE